MEVGSGKKIIEAFFWVEPTRTDANSPFSGTKVLWHYPEDVSPISKQFRDIPQFCFPDLNSLKLDKVGEVISDQYIFTLTDKDGQRFYDIFSIGLLEHSRGICKGFVYTMLETMIHDVNNGQFTVPIQQLLPFALETIPSLKYNLEFKYQIPKQSKFYLRDVTILPIFQILGVDRFFKLLSAILSEQRILFVSHDVSLLTSTIFSTLVMIYPFHWHHVFITLLPPKLISYLAAPVPYIIGSKKSVLSEVSRDIANGVLIVDLDTAEIFPNGNVVEFDLVGDSGTALKQASESFDRVRQGVANIFLGKGAAVENETAAQKDLMAMLVLDLKGALSAKPGSSSLSSVASGLLRGLPGTAKTLEEAKAQWSLETEKTIRESLTCFFVFLFADLDDFWVGDTTASNSTKAPSNGRGSSDLVFSSRDYRSKFDLKGFIHRRLSNGLSKLLHEFLLEFLHSQMFEKYCENKYTQRMANITSLPSASNRSNRAASTASTSSTSSAANDGGSQEIEDLFDSACSELRYRSQVVNVVNAKQAVTSRSTLHTGDAVSTGGYGSTGKINLAGFHSWTLQYTATSDSENLASVELFDPYFGSNAKKSQYQAAQSSILDRILQDLINSDMVKKIFTTITFRIESLKACSCRGSTAISGIKALQLLQILLIQGPNVVLPLGLELIPLLRSLLRFNKQLSKGSQTSSFDFVVSGSYINPRSTTLVVLGLLADHRRLLVQRSVHLLEKQVTTSTNLEGGKPSLPPRRNSTTSIASQSWADSTNQPPRKDLLVTQSSHSKTFPSFQQIHAKFNEVKLASIKPGFLRVSVPEKAAIIEADDDDRNESLLQFDDEPPVNTTSTATNNSTSQDLLEINEVAVPRSVTPPPTRSRESNVTITPSALSTRSSSPKPVGATNSTTVMPSNSSKVSPTSNGKPSGGAGSIRTPVTPVSALPKKPQKEADLLGLETEETAPYRLKNLDTVTSSVDATTAAASNVSTTVNAAAIKLKPPPTDKTAQGSAKRVPPKPAQNDLLFGGDNFLSAPVPSSATAVDPVKGIDPFAAKFGGIWDAPATATRPITHDKADLWGSSDPFASSFPATTTAQPSTDPFALFSSPSSDPFGGFGAAPFPFTETKPAPPTAFPSASDPFASFGSFPSASTVPAFPSTGPPLQPPPVYKPIQTNPPAGYRPGAPKDPFADLLNFESKR